MKPLPNHKSAKKGIANRITSSGLWYYYWFVRLRHRGKHRRITLGRAEELDAGVARAQARRLLAEVALDGLPKRAVVKATPILSDFVDIYWEDLARHWKASTASRNQSVWRLYLKPAFGTIRVADITPADIHRWRDSCAGPDEAKYNRSVPVLASLLKYAELLHLRRNGSNPCRGMPRYKRPPRERYLTPMEYRRISAALREDAEGYPLQVAIIRLLLSTGARVGEIQNLRWEWVQPPRLVLPDSKTGPKTIWLNSQALEVIASIQRR
ncbi:tyrosine-type recombinase/integrase, partial [Blastomonas sp.]|uniref:tyrosine-type recombinase/integrase n=1 Tax=Blastomonas sp. TaxID=1909299 RepID=UPI00359305D0